MDTSINSANKPSNDIGNSNFNTAFYSHSNYGVSSSFSAQSANAGLATNINSNAKEDILESVDVLTEYGRFGLAIHLLQDYLTDHPSESPKVWLKLLSLTAAHGSESEYAQAVADCNNFYRIHMPSFADAKKVGSATIEDFPHITKALETAWRSASALPLLNNLIYNRESQPQDGFEPEVFEQLFMLKQIAENLNIDPSSIDPVAQTLPDAMKIDPTSYDEESASSLQESTTSLTTAPIINTFETSSDVLTENTQDTLPQAVPSSETFPTLNFDDYFTQDSPAELKPENSTASTAENLALPELDQTLQFPEIDTTQHIQKVANAEETKSEPAPRKLMATDGKTEKRIVKDSNLIDWVFTDET